MPLTVPRYGGPKVAEQPLPGVRLNTDVPSAAFRPPQPVDFSGVEKVAAQIHAEESQKADQVAVLAADNQLNDLETGVLHGPTGVLNRQGLDAMAASADVRDTWTKRTSEIWQGLTNDNQRLAFERATAYRWARVNEQMETHVDSETKKYDTNQTVTALDNARNDAVLNYSDPARIQQAVETQVATVKDFAARHKLPQSYVETAVSDNLSQLHAAVVDRMLANGQDLAASKYYGDNKPQINGATSTEIEKWIGSASVLGEAQRQADSILASSVTMGAALNKASAIQEPKVRERAEERIRQAFLDRANDLRRQGDEAFQRAGDVLEHTGDVRNIPRQDWLAISVQDREALRRREDQLHGGGDTKRETDMGTYTSLINMSSLNDSTRQAFDNLNLLPYRSKLSDSDFKHLLELQRSSRLKIEGAAATQARRDQSSAERRGQNWEIAKSMGAKGDLPAVPGAPIHPQGPPTTTSGGAPLPSSQQLRQVPQRWLDFAKQNPDYLKKLLDSGAYIPWIHH